LEEKLVCSICLELFKVPITLPCGHNFCKRCISDHQGKQEQAAAGAKQGFSCPECRQSCAPQLELKKNVTLSKVLELVRASKTGVKQCEVTPGGLPLELYCEDEQRCICCVCTVQQCQRHRRALLEDVHSRKQALLEKSVKEAQEESEKIERALQELEERTQSIKVMPKFAHLEKSLQAFQCQMVAKVEQELSAALRRVEENSNTLKGHLDTLRQHQEQARDLLVSTTDHRTFLEEFPLLPAWESLAVPPPVQFDAAGVVEPLSEILAGISRLLLEDLPGATAPKSPDPIVPALHSLNRSSWREPGAVKVGPSISAPRVPFLSPDHRNLTFDPDTANKYLELSKGQRRARHGTGAARCRWVAGAGQPLRALAGAVRAGLRAGLPAAGSIGLDGGSWGLQVREDGYLAWHKGREEKIQERLYTQLGVRLDYGRGLLSFYGLGEETRLIHFHAVFTEPLYPVFWLCEGRAVTL
ncbi:Tripartite motif-containing protein 65, partial [Anas platyrhynchos]